MTYQVGDRVQYVLHENLVPSKLSYQGWSADLLGQFSVILKVLRGRYGVEFERPFPYGHTCNELGKDGYCYWVKEGFITPVNIELTSYEDML